MECIAKRVEEKVASRLSEKFALIMDSWSAGTTHCIGLFASYSTGLGDPENTLLAFSPFIDETNFGADQHVNFINWVVTKVNRKKMVCITCIISDNCSINKKVAELLGVPMLGCASQTKPGGRASFVRSFPTLLIEFTP